jgi:hypothetical protein
MTLQEKRTHMLSLVESWMASGLSQSEYARKHQVNLIKFRYWVNKHRSDTSDAAAFIELSGFPRQDICIRYPNGVEMVLSAQTPTVVLRSLINL